MALELTDRDLAVLLYTWQNRFVATRHLHRAFWPEASLPAATQRLVTLREKGYLGFRSFPWLQERVLYFASLEGNRALAKVGLLPEAYIHDYPRKPEESTPALRHDLTVVDLRLALEETGADGRTWVSDHQLRLENRRRGVAVRVPDGVFEFEVEGRRGKGVLEFENAPYRRPRVAAILTRLRVHYPEHQVFIVTKSAARAAAFRTWAANVGVYADHPEQVVVADLADVAEKGLEAGFKDLMDQDCPGNTT
ncbi:MAG: hypothetical protein ACREKE_03505 [bacterium]